MAPKPAPSKFPSLAELTDRMECFGEFSGGDSVCKSFCALALNCALTSEGFQASRFSVEFVQRPLAVGRDDYQ
jgi:hypothetical protein